MIDRRALLAGTLAAATVPASAIAAPTGDYPIDWQGLPADPAIATRLARQIAMVRALPIRPDILAFFARQTIVVSAMPGEGSHAGRDPQVVVTRDPVPDDNPVLLHELIHRWHFTMLANTPRAAAVQANMPAVYDFVVREFGLRS